MKISVLGVFTLDIFNLRPRDINVINFLVNIEGGYHDKCYNSCPTLNIRRDSVTNVPYIVTVTILY